MADIKICLIFLFFVKFSKCTKRMEGFVVGGEYARIEDYPHSVFLNGLCAEHRESWICGSSILNQMTLLTAGHCLHGCGDNLKIDVYTGHENLEKAKVIRQSDKYIIHQEYHEWTTINDIGLVMLTKAMDLNAHSKRVIINNSFPSGKISAVVAGWGTVNDETDEDTILLKVTEQQVLGEEELIESGYKLGPGMILVGSFDRNAGRPSTGDSGSGLITPSLQQIGLVSFMIPPNRALIIYTNVSYYYDWILEQSKLMYCDSRLNI